MTRLEFIDKHRLTCYKRYSTVEMREKYPNLKFFYRQYQCSVKNCLLYDNDMSLNM